MANMGNLLNDLARYVESEQLLRESLPLHVQALGEDHPRTAVNRSLLGAALTGLQRYEEAETLLLQTYAGLEASLPPAGTRAEVLAPTIKRLVRLYEAWGKPEKAGEWREKLTAAEAQHAD